MPLGMVRPSRNARKSLSPYLNFPPNCWRRWNGTAIEMSGWTARPEALCAEFRGVFSWNEYQVITNFPSEVRLGVQVVVVVVVVVVVAVVVVVVLDPPVL